MPSARTKFHYDLFNSVYTLGGVTKFPFVHPVFVTPQELSPEESQPMYLSLVQGPLQNRQQFCSTLWLYNPQNQLKSAKFIADYTFLINQWPIREAWIRAEQNDTESIFSTV